MVGIKEVVNLLHKCGYEILYANIHRLNNSLANEVAINTNQVLPSKQMVSHFNLKRFNSREIMSSQNKEKAECENV